jgi:uncharacterized membrane protein
MTRNKLWVRSGIAGLSLLPMLAIAQESQYWPGWSGPGPGPWRMMWDGGGWGFWWIMPLMMFALMIFVCGYIIMRGPWMHRDHHADSTTSALRILNERFAQGLISKDEFEEKKATLARRA